MNGATNLNLGYFFNIGYLMSSQFKKKFDQLKSRINKLNEIISKLDNLEIQLSNTRYSEQNRFNQQMLDFILKVKPRVQEVHTLITLNANPAPLGIDTQVHEVHLDWRLSNCSKDDVKLYRDIKWLFSTSNNGRLREHIKNQLDSLIGETNNQIDLINQHRELSEIILDCIKTIANCIIWFCTLTFVPSFFSTTSQPVDIIKAQLINSQTTLNGILDIALELDKNKGNVVDGSPSVG